MMIEILIAVAVVMDAAALVARYVAVAVAEHRS